MSATATANPTTTEFDADKAGAFAAYATDVMNKGLATLAISIGHKAGLFDSMAGLPPSTPEQVAAAAGLQERYVREWLNAMTAARIVEYDPGTKTYVLPAEHAACLTRAAGPNNLAGFAQFAGLVAPVEDQLVECFRAGGGVPYSQYTAFQKMMAADSAPVFDATLLQLTLPNVPGLVDRLNAGIDVADIGCGEGHAINIMARAFPKSRFTGLDISVEAVEAGRAEARAWGLENATFEVLDVAQLSRPGSYDFVTAFDAIHDQAAPRKVLRNIREALRPGGTFLMVDLAASSNVEENLEHPMAAALYTISLTHCMTVSLASGGEGLGAMWGQQKARELLAEAGFTDVQVTQIEGDFFNFHYICR